MLTFLQETLNHIQKTDSNLSEATFVLPSKRAGGFLKNYLRKSATSSQFLPKIISIEDLIQELSGLEIIDTTELLFKSYEVYTTTDAFKEKETFDQYSGWATTLLNDFNEVDRHLINTQQFFDYLGSIKALERWNVSTQKTEFLESYVAFWKSLPEFYENIKSQLLGDGVAYQGLVYREAVAALEYYLQSHPDNLHYFIGFNALNTAEQHIIQAFLEMGNAHVFWDAEQTFVNDTVHSASLFFRKYMATWNYFQKHSPQFVSNHFAEPKKINIVACQKNMAQVKYVGDLLTNYSEEKLNNTAIVLADEVLLMPLLHSLPKNVIQVNVTMGAAIKSFPTTVFLETWLSIQQKNTSRHYYKDILRLLGHPIASKLLDADALIQAISKENRSHYTVAELQALIPNENNSVINLLFTPNNNDVAAVLGACVEILQCLKQVSVNQTISKVVLFELYGIIEKLQALHSKFEHITSVGALQQLFLELIAGTTIDFKGDAYEGLQIMGVLETRVLDFENVIVLSVNEGILPSGKSNASFITYDLKKQFDLPLFTEKDAIYTYHFYHLLHRASEITLCYTNFTEGLNSGEKSRFLLQLEIEGLPQHQLANVHVVPGLSLSPKTFERIDKTASVMERLREIAAKGFSPSALTSYIRNPIDFYYQKIIKVQELEEVEETVAYNTLGTVVHDTLQVLYEPYVGADLTQDTLQKMRGTIAKVVATQFAESFYGGDLSKGKNLIIFEIAKRYVENAVALDISEVKKGSSLKLLHIESDLRLEISIPSLDFPVAIHGKVDRVDLLNGQVRIIDYKTGTVQQRDLEIIDWEPLATDYKFSKAFQVLTYALMMQGEEPIENAEAGIISFKNMNSGFMKFATKESARGQKNTRITQEVLQLFTEQLTQLILEICNPEIPFVEKEIE
tara:strand:- start:63506 stop:66229 length:2724 start_codon:yes stop_codon:yes gene_type:complete